MSATAQETVVFAAEPAVVYMPSGKIAGIPLLSGDPILNTRWIGDSVNITASREHTQENALIAIDGTGRYQATAYQQAPGTSCLRRLSWTGQLYKVGERLYAAWNTGTDHFYLVNVAPGYKSVIANSVSDSLNGLSERTELFRNDVADLRLLTRMLEQASCPPP